METALTIEGYQCTEIANEGYGGYAICHQYTLNGTTYTGTAPGLFEILPACLSDPRGEFSQYRHPAGDRNQRR